MAVIGFLTLDKVAGNGNDTVNVAAGSDRTGRNSRSQQLTFSAANCPDVVRTVIQAGKPEFVQIQSTAAEGKEGGNLTISGKSNSSKLTFSLASGGTLVLTLPSTYIANSVTTNNGADITGDPGANAEYNFSITFQNIPANTSVSALTAQLIVEDNAGHTATCQITQAAADPYMTVSPASIELDWDSYSEGTSATATVESNTNWTIE